jgi:hypothetical protein
MQGSKVKKKISITNVWLKDNFLLPTSGRASTKALRASKAIFVEIEVPTD